MNLKKIICILLASLMLMTLLVSCGNQSTVDGGKNTNQTPVSEKEDLNMNAIVSLSEKVRVEAEPGASIKPNDEMNPLVSTRFSADPTSVEYNGRVYVFSTNDDQQYLATPYAVNGFGDIHSLNVFSSADLVNWTDHGYIDVKAASPRINTSWAPSIVKRVEDDGLTHFYLFYAENGWSTGVLTATDPLGPWTDPLGRPVIVPTMPEVNGILSNCFDPGALCDDDGTIYVACGAHKDSDVPGVSKGSGIFKLDDDLNIVEGPYVFEAPYFFEASEMNKIGDKYVYTFNGDWSAKEYPVEGYTKSPTCAMEYMVADDPMGPYTYVGWYLRNPGESNLLWGNNHTHLQEFKGNWYIISHSRLLEKHMGMDKSYRSVMIDKIDITIDEEGNVNIPHTYITAKGVEQVEYLDPYVHNEAETICNQSGIMTQMIGNVGDVIVTDIKDGDWIRVKGVDFGSNGAAQFVANVKGTGVIDIRLDDVNSETVGSVDFSVNEFTNIINNIDNITGVHDVYFVFGGKNWEFDAWQFVETAPSAE